MTAVAFDRFRFDLDSLELFSDGERIDLAPKPGILLRGLIESAPNMLTREDAQALLWPDGPHADPEHGLNACMRQLRVALGDNGTSPKFVETLPKRGYRFLVPTSESVPDTGRTGVRKAVVVGAVSLFAVAALIVLFASVFRPDAVQTADDLAAPLADMIARAGAFRARQGDGDLEQALRLYEEVLAVQPRAAPALGGKAITLVKLAGHGEHPRQVTYDTALEFAAAADAIHPLPDAAAARAYVHLYGGLDPAQALAHFEEAVRRDERHAESHAGMAAAMSALGRSSDAVDAATSAAYLDPLSYSARSDRCWYLLFDRRFGEAVDACTWAIEIDADHTYSHLGIAVAARGDQERVKSAFDEYLAAQGLPAGQGDIVDGEFTCALARRIAGYTDVISPYEIASFYALCGASEETAEWLQRTAARRQPALLYYPYDPRFDAVRGRLPSVDDLLGRSPAVDAS